MEFWTSLIKTPDKNNFLADNCTHVVGDYWIYEGEKYLLSDELTRHEIVGEGGVPCLGDLTESEIIKGCIEWYGVELPLGCAKKVSAADAVVQIDSDYVKELEKLAEELITSMENMLSIVDPKRKPICGNMGAANQAALLIDQYHELKQEWSND